MCQNKLLNLEKLEVFLEKKKRETRYAIGQNEVMKIAVLSLLHFEPGMSVRNFGNRHRNN